MNAKRRTDPVAVASVVTAVVGLPVVPIWLGLKARRRIRTSDRGGDTVAIAGIWLGSIQLVLWTLFLLFVDPGSGGGEIAAPGVCSPAPENMGTFEAAFDFLRHKRESESGGVCVGGPSEMFALAQSHMKVSLVAILIAVAISVPVGLWLGHIGRGEFLAISVSNVGRAVPSLALLAFFVAFIGLGFANIAAVLVLLAIPPMLTNTYVGVRQVDRETVDAARGVGMTEAQIIRKIELPMSLATIFSGVRTSAVAVVATATIAPLGNVRSLGNPILEPGTYRLPGEVGAAILVALITLALDAGLAAVQRAVTPEGLKVSEKPEKAKRLSLPIPWRTETQ